jgi:hypothetical protein
MLIIEAFSAKRNIGFVTTNELNRILKDSSEGKVSVLVANLANGCQLLYFLSSWNEIYDIVEACAQKSSIQSRNDHNLSFIRSFFREFDYLNQIKLRT